MFYFPIFLYYVISVLNLDVKIEPPFPIYCKMTFLRISQKMEGHNTKKVNIYHLIIYMTYVNRIY